MPPWTSLVPTTDSVTVGRELAAGPVALAAGAAVEHPETAPKARPTTSERASGGFGNMRRTCPPQVYGNAADRACPAHGPQFSIDDTQAQGAGPRPSPRPRPSPGPRPSPRPRP